jgi:hypothetical protein
VRYPNPRTRIKKLRIDRVDVVDRGDAPASFVALTKRHPRATITEEDPMTTPAEVVSKRQAESRLDEIAKRHRSDSMSEPQAWAAALNTPEGVHAYTIYKRAQEDEAARALGCRTEGQREQVVKNKEIIWGKIAEAAERMAEGDALTFEAALLKVLSTDEGRLLYNMYLNG